MAIDRIFSFFLLMALLSCAAERPLIPPPLDLPAKVVKHDMLKTVDVAPEVGLTLSISETPKPPDRKKAQAGEAAQPQSVQAEAANISLLAEQMPLPSLIQMVYGAILKKNVNIDPAVNARTDLVTIRTGTLQTPTQVADMIRLLLKSYGVAVIDIGGLIRIVPDNANLGYLPEIRRGYALPETPLPMRPIFQLVELQAVRNADVSGWIKTMFGDKVKMQDDQTRNAILLNGQSSDVMAALEAIQVLDQPFMKGRQSVRISPVFWSAEDLTRKMVDILQAEGYNAGSTAPFTWSVTVLPIPAIGGLILFCGDKALLDHAVGWATELDKPNERGGGKGLFSYQAKYTDADALAKTLQQLLNGNVATPVAAGKIPVVASRVVVDQPSNTLIIQGGEDYSQIRSLLLTLDKPAKQALIEVTVAEVNLTEDYQLGVEWMLNQSKSGGNSMVAGTLGGLAIGSSGFNYSLLGNGGDIKVLLNALASSNRATVLSSPRIVARSGESATIQVGQEVPIITSQQVSPGTNTGGSTTTTSTTVPQSIQYRTTGVILNVKPVIHSDDQVALEISQEVSAAALTATGVSNSPTFSTRKVQTKLSLKNGATVLLGGLISGDKSDGDAGIPGLKDVPLLGQLFRNSLVKNRRTELIVLITPYIIGDDHDAEEITKAFKKQLGSWANQTALPAPLTRKPADGGALVAKSRIDLPTKGVEPASPKAEKPM